MRAKRRRNPHPNPRPHPHPHPHPHQVLEEWEENDEDEDEIGYNGFCKLLARLCNCKIPPESRGGLPFEVTLDNWLGLHIIPLYKRIMSDKVRGLGRSFGA